MKKIFVIAFTLVGSVVAFGQNNAQEASLMTNKIVADLGLNATQAQQVADIYNGIGAKNEAVLSDPNASEQFKKDALKGNTEAGEYLVNNVLTPEQQTKWNEIKASEKATQRQNSPVQKAPLKPANKVIIKQD